MSETALLERFYAVTSSASVYLASINREQDARIVKVAKRGNLLTGPTEEISNPMLAIAKHLVLFVPEGGGITSYQREITMVNDRYWTYITAPIVALFLQEGDALICSSLKDITECDQRWKESTIAVLKAVGREHPRCSISTAMSRFWLMPPAEWQN